MFGESLTSNDITSDVTLSFILSTYQLATSLLNDEVSKRGTYQELLSDWSLYLSVLHMMGQLKDDLKVT